MVAGATLPLLELEGLAKSFARDGIAVPVVAVPRFALARGEQVAIAGGSGSGKTTLLNLIAGLLRPDRGAIRFLGQDVAPLSEAERDRHRARHLGYVFQTHHLLPGHGALDNVLLGMAFGAGVDRERARELLARLGLRDRERHRPAELSVGQRQRVAVARALAGRPELVLADEPTGALDRALARETLALLRQTCREEGAALLLVTHDPEALAEFERVERMEAWSKSAAGAGT